MTEYTDQLLSHFEKLAADNTEDSIEQLQNYLLKKDSGTYEKHIIPRMACFALMQKGVRGVDVLSEVLPNAPGSIYPMAILSALWHWSEGRQNQMMFIDIPESSTLSGEIPQDVRLAAKRVFLRFVDDSKSDPEAFDRLIQLLYQEQMLSASDRYENSRFHRALFRTIAESSITITNSILESYEKLLSEERREEEYQQFLVRNPVFLDPLGSRLIPKQKLGDDYITDYVLEKLTGDYVAVEIEKPSDPIFTQGNDFTHQFSHGFGQVLDFIEWVEQNIAYAQKKLDGISSPEGLLVIGMRSKLSADQQKKLARFNKNSVSVKVKTFDDLLFEATTLLKNLHAKVEFDI